MGFPYLCGYESIPRYPDGTLSDSSFMDVYSPFYIFLYGKFIGNFLVAHPTY